MKKVVLLASFLAFYYVGFTQTQTITKEKNIELDEGEVIESEELRTDKNYQASKVNHKNSSNTGNQNNESQAKKEEEIETPNN